MTKSRNKALKGLRYLSFGGVVTLGLLAIIATGGGGGGGGVAPLTYTGVTAQATVNDGNADPLATGSYLGGHVGSAMGLGVSAQAAEVGRPRALKVSQALEQAIRGIDIGSSLTGAPLRAVFTYSDTLLGSCGGSASFTISIDDQTGNFSGQLTFTKFCEQGVKISGYTSFSGWADLALQAPMQFTVSFSFLSVRSAEGDSFAMSGSISYDYLVTPANVSIEALIRDNSTMKVYWINNFTMTLDVVFGPPDYVEFTMSGRYYDPDYGWVAVSTPTPFQVFDGDIWPSQGVLIAEGLPDQFADPTQARLTAIPSPPAWGYVVDCEYGDNGNFDDWTSDFQPWE